MFFFQVFNSWYFSYGNDGTQTQNPLIPRKKPNRFGHTNLYGQNGYISLMESKPLTLNLFITMIRYAGSLYVVLGRIFKPQENLWIDSYGIIVVQLRTNYYGLCLFLIVAGLTTRGWSFLVMLYWTIFAGDVSFFLSQGLKLLSAIFLIKSPPPPPKWQPFKNRKMFLFHLKSSFRSQDIQIFVFFLFLSTLSRFKRTNGRGIIYIMSSLA